jgi:hypothetical protein
MSVLSPAAGLVKRGVRGDVGRNTGICATAADVSPLIRVS